MLRFCLSQYTLDPTLSLSSLTVALWYHSNEAEQYGSILSLFNRVSQSNHGFVISLENGQNMGLFVEKPGQNGEGFALLDDQAPLNQWIHFAISYDWDNSTSELSEKLQYIGFPGYNEKESTLYMTSEKKN